MRDRSCLSELTIDRYTIDPLLTQILRIDKEEFYLQNLSTDKLLPRLLARITIILSNEYVSSFTL